MIRISGIRSRIPAWATNQITGHLTAFSSQSSGSAALDYFEMEITAHPYFARGSGIRVRQAALSLGEIIGTMVKDVAQ